MRDGRRKALRVADGPQRQKAAVATAGDAHARLIHIRLRGNVIRPGHHVRIVAIAPVFLDGPAMRFAIAVPTARVTEMHHVILSRQQVKFVHEDVPVLQPGATMDFQHRCVRLRRIEPRRRHYPALHIVTVDALDPYALHIAQIDFIQPVAVDARQLLPLFPIRVTAP